MKALVLDSAETVMTVLSKIIEQAGHEAEGFLSGDELLEAEPDGEVLLAMVNMHPPNGFDVLETLIERGRAIPTVLMSGTALDKEDYARGDRLGAWRGKPKQESTSGPNGTSTGGTTMTRMRNRATGMKRSVTANIGASANKKKRVEGRFLDINHDLALVRRSNRLRRAGEVG